MRDLAGRLISARDEERARIARDLHEIDLDSGRVTAKEGKSTATDYQRILDFFAYAKLPGSAEDQALVRRIAAKAGVVI